MYYMIIQNKSECDLNTDLKYLNKPFVYLVKFIYEQTAVLVLDKCGKEMFRSWKGYLSQK